MSTILLMVIINPVDALLQLLQVRRSAVSTTTTRAADMRLGAAKKTLGSKGKDETFYCTECGAEHINWVGRCNVCKAWNTVKQFRVPKTMPAGGPRRSFINADGAADSTSAGGWVGSINDRGDNAQKQNNHFKCYILTLFPLNISNIFIY